MAHQTRGWIPYAPDAPYNPLAMSIKADNTTATNNGATLQNAPIPNTPFWPGHRADLRAVYGVEASTRMKDSCIAISPNGTLFVLGATFSDNEGNSYVVNGLRVQRFRTRNLK